MPARRFPRFLLLAALTATATPTPGQVVPDAPTQAAEHARLGDSWSTRGQFAQAVAEYSEAIRLDPTRASYHYKRGMTYRAARAYVRAEEDFSAIIKLEPKNPEGYYLRATCYPFGPMPSVWDPPGASSEAASLPDPCHAGAIADLTEALRLDPKMTKAYFARAAEYIMTKPDHARAVADFDAAIQLTPPGGQLAYLYWCRGYAHALLQGNHGKAVADYSKAIDLDSRLTMAYAARACSYQRLGKLKEALADYTTALNLDPRYGLAYRQRAEVETALGDLQAAEADRLRAKLLPTEPFATPVKPW